MSNKKKLTDLRAELKKQGVDGFIVPHSDEYQCEYLPDCAERLAWLTGFTGSAGMAVVLEDKAIVFTDGRYALQITEQTDAALYETDSSLETTSSEWIVKNSKKSKKIGYDPKLMTPTQITETEETLSAVGIDLVPLDNNPIDTLWSNQPPSPESDVVIFPESIAGTSSADKRDKIAKALKDNGEKAVLITKADSVAWLLNIRGKDVANTPVALSYVILHDDGNADLFIDKARISPDVQRHLGNQIQICDPATLQSKLEAFGNVTVAMDFNNTSIWFKNILESKGTTVENKKDPCIDPRAQKTPSEQKAIINAHVKDGVALTKFLAWLDSGALDSGTHTEVTVADKLEAFRRMDPDCRDLSFPTISGWNANGAIVHYKADPSTCATISGDGMLLVDSGGQYSGGTTDVTRTIAIGNPTQEMKDDFTSVLKGHISVGSLIFPSGTTGKEIDVLARKALWTRGKDYAHGTGHGVGCNLAVHESGVGISSRASDAFAPGMLVSNEPGYYKEGAYGIRIENLVMVEKDDQLSNSKDNHHTLMMKFNTVTMAPIDSRLINLDMLENSEIGWLNEYHDRVYNTLSPLLSSEPDTVAWLKSACAPLKNNTGKKNAASRVNQKPASKPDRNTP